MATSLYAKSSRVIRQAQVGTGVGGGQTKLTLPKESLVGELRLIISASQAYTGVPGSSDVRRFIKSIELTTNQGQLIYVDGFQAYDLSRFTETTTFAPVVNLGATSTASWAFDLHLENDEARRDLATAIRANQLTGFDLTITWAPDANNGFIGGTVPLATSYNVTVESIEYPDLLARGDVATHFHRIKSQMVQGSATGNLADIELNVDNGTRLIMLHAYSVSAGVLTPSDAVLDNISLLVGGQQKRVTKALSCRVDNVVSRSIGNITGLYVLDFGDDETGFLSLYGVKRAPLQLSVATSGAPANWAIGIAQDATYRSM